ncbi:hypothetical protein PIROE2DRAFT_13053, partial [Piromyces sp. E2]
MGFSIINVVGIIVNINIKIKLLLGIIIGGICCLASPFLWRRNKIKLKEYGKGKKDDKTNDKSSKEEIVKSNSLSSIRKRKSYNNVDDEEKSISSKNDISSDEHTTTSESNDSYTEYSSEKTLSEEKSNDDDSNFGSFDRKFSREELYNGIEKIVGTIALREPIVIYSKPCECELISRFIRYNNSNEALNALDDIFNEGIGQYPKNTSVNDEWGIYNSNDEIFKKKTEREIKYIERIDEAIQQVNELKPGLLSRYKISYIKSVIDEDKEKQHDYEMRKKYEHFKKIKEQSSKYHISTLCYLRDCIEFTYGNDFNDTYYSNYLMNIHNLKKLTEQSYATFMQLYPDQDCLNNAYNLYLTDVMGDPYSLNKDYEMGDKESIIEDDFETFTIKHRESSASNHSRRMSLIPSQMVHTNDIKIPSRRRSSSEGRGFLSTLKENEGFNNVSNDNEYDNNVKSDNENYEKFAAKGKNKGKNSYFHDHNYKGENIEMPESIPEDKEIHSANFSTKKSLHIIEEKYESKETLSNIGLDSSEKQRRESLKSYSEISSSINREQRKSTAM